MHNTSQETSNNMLFEVCEENYTKELVASIIESERDNLHLQIFYCQMLQYQMIPWGHLALLGQCFKQKIQVKVWKPCSLSTR